MIAVSAAIRKLEARIDAVDSLLCVGLDPDVAKLPERFQGITDPLFAFCREVIDATASYACAVKPNLAFFEAKGAQGWEELSKLCAYVREHHPDLFLLCDGKRGDIGSTNRGYVSAILDGLGADAMTVHPYLGAEALEPVLSRREKACIVLCRTSNPGAGEFQDLRIGDEPLWERVARQVSETWNTHGNCMLVVGATWPEELKRIRETAPDMSFLVPGIGTQGGDIETTVRAGLRQDGKGLVLSSSRAILYADDPARAARDMRDAIQSARERVYAG